ncbi:helix-turn-helix domain-containing protein [Nocardia sp. NPDC050630]|uniref:helix-turn-helix domain-containing protein n=1 Tax=Nocardia sp. NPDC050630 TaxID=3364321 RepID=UPI0037A0AB7F
MSTRRDDILDAARDLIVREGYAGASMHAIARAAGVTRPGLYAEFSNRDELFEALLVREEERVLAMAAEATPVFQEGADLASVAADISADAVDIFLDLVSAAPQSWRFVLMSGEGLPDTAHERVDRGRAALRARGRAVLALIAARTEQEMDEELLSHAVISASETGARLVLAADGAHRRAAVSKTLRWVARRAVAAAGVGEQ